MVCLRLQAANRDDVTTVSNYVKRTRKQIIYKAAATAWAHGVPWAHALDVATKAVNKGQESARKPLVKAKGKGKGRAKGKGKGR